MRHRGNEVSVDVLGISWGQDCAKEMMSVVMDKVNSEITRVKPKDKDLCSIRNDEMENSWHICLANKS